MIGGTNFEAIGDFAAGGSEDALDLTNAGTGFMSLGDVLAHFDRGGRRNSLIERYLSCGSTGQVFLAGVAMASFDGQRLIFV